MDTVSRAIESNESSKSVGRSILFLENYNHSHESKAISRNSSSKTWIWSSFFHHSISFDELQLFDAHRRQQLVYDNIIIYIIIVSIAIIIFELFVDHYFKNKAIPTVTQRNDDSFTDLFY
jgi:hypothetical protein